MAGQSYAWWVGQDGNAYIKDASGTRSMGNQYTLGNDGSALFDGGGLTASTRIADPVATRQVAPSNPTGASKPALNTGAVANTQASIDQIAPLLQSAMASESQNHINSNNTFDQQQQTQQAAHDASTVTNQNNYDSNFMASIRSGIQGLGGLMALLRGSGAAGGTAEDQVKDVVGGTTADDIRGGADTQKQNQSAVDGSLATFLTDLKGKRQANDDTYTNNLRSIQRDSETQLQDLYSKMAGFYGDAGNTATANDFMAKAGSLTPQIAANSKTQVSNYDTTPVAVQAPQLTAFAAPTTPTIATAPADGQVGSGIFTLNKRKDDSQVPLVAAQGA